MMVDGLSLSRPLAWPGVLRKLWEGARRWPAPLALRGRETSQGAAPVEADVRQGLGLRLLTQVDALPSRRRAAVAVSLSVLWDAFRDGHGDIRRFVASGPAAQGYVDDLSRSAARMWPARDTAKGHYFYATALMALSASYWLRPGQGELARRLARTTSALIMEGRSLRDAAKTRAA